VRVTACLIAASALGCGGKPICPNGDCSVPGVTVVEFRFDHYPQWGFDSDTCMDLAVANVHVDATDATGAVTSQDVPCDYGQASFTGLAPGAYTIAITPLDKKGHSVVSAPVTAMVTAAGVNKTVMAEVDVPYTAWTGSFTGTFLFWTSWGGQTCASATPPVVTQVLTLAVNGQVVGASTDSGQRLDGSDPEPCRALTEAYPQFAKGVPFGPAELTVAGKDENDDVVFHHVFDTFVGAGSNNPTLTFDLASAPTDAGVDGPMDGPMDGHMDGHMDDGADAPMDGP
jgi:hypothetical protein